MIKVHTALTQWDLLVVIFAVMVTVAAVVWGNRLKYKTQTKAPSGMLEYILMGRQLTLPLFVPTLVATWYGGINGVTQIAFESGIYNFVTQGFFWYAIYFIFAFFMVSRIRNVAGMTLPDLVDKLFGSRAKKFSRVANLLDVIPVTYVLSLGNFLAVCFGGTPFVWSAVGLALVMGYSYKSGFRAVVFSDFVQFVFMCLGVFLVLFFSIKEWGGFQILYQSLPSHYFQITGNHSLLETLSWGLIAITTLVDPNFYQRVLAAKDDRTAKLGILISIFIWFAFDICTTFGAMYAKMVMPNESSALAYFNYALHLLPSGFRGLFVGGILMTIVSTMDSYLLIAASSLKYDFKTTRFFPKKGWLEWLLLAVFTLVLSHYFSGNVKQVWKTLGGLSSVTLLIPITGKVLFRLRITEIHFIASFIISTIVYTFFRIFPIPNFDAIYPGLATSIVVVIIGLNIFPQKR